MEYTALVIAVVCSAAGTLISKQYNIKVKLPNTYLFTAVASVIAAIFFIAVSGGKLEFNAEFIIYSILWAATFAATVIGSVKAVSTGPVTVTALISQCSLVLPIIYSVLALNESISGIGYVGIVLLLIALFMINFKNEKLKIEPRWFLWVTMVFIGNGMSAVIQKMHQIKFKGSYKCEYMIVAFFVAAVVTALAGIHQKTTDKQEIKSTVKYASMYGLTIGALNMLVMILSLILSASVLYASISAGGMIIIFVFSAVFYREKFSFRQLVGYVIGVISLIFINV